VSEPCNCDGSGKTPNGLCRWCNAGEALRQAGDPIPPQAMTEIDARVIKEGVITERRIIDYPTTIEADHKDTTEPHEH
jgi:hypothetical protein